MRYSIGLAWVIALGAALSVGCSSDSKEGPPDLEWPPNATAYFDEYGILNADCATDEDCAMVLGYYHASENYEDLLFKHLAGEPIELVFDIEKAKANAVRTVTFD